MRTQKAIAEVCRILFATKRNRWVGRPDNNGQVTFVMEREIITPKGLMLYPIKKNTAMIIEKLKEAMAIFNINDAKVTVTAHYNSSEETYDIYKQEAQCKVLLDDKNTLNVPPLSFTIRLEVPKETYMQNIKPYINTRIKFEKETLGEIYCRVAKTTPMPIILDEVGSYVAATNILFGKRDWLPSKEQVKRGYEGIFELNSEKSLQHSETYKNFNPFDLFCTCITLKLLTEKLNYDKHISMYGSLTLSNDKFSLNLYSIENPLLWSMINLSTYSTLTLTIRVPATFFKNYIAKGQAAVGKEKLSLEDIEALTKTYSSLVAPLISSEKNLVQIHSAYWYDTDDYDEPKVPDEYNEFEDRNADVEYDTAVRGMQRSLDFRGYDNPANRYRKWIIFSDDENQNQPPSKIQKIEEKPKPVFVTEKQREENKEKGAIALSKMAEKKVDSIVTTLNSKKYPLAKTLLINLKKSENANIAECILKIDTAILKLISELKDTELTAFTQTEFYQEFKNAKETFCTPESSAKTTSKP